MKRTPIAELLDSDAGTPAQVAGSLRDLRFINRAFGGISTACKLLESVSRKTGRQKMSLLEVAAGSSDVPQLAAERLREEGIALDIAVLDRVPSHLNGARPAIVGDALALPCRSESFDLVSCSLFAHHLMPGELQQFITEALRVCRVAVLINDLIRNPLHLALVYAGLPLFRSRLTWHDAPASVRQAYTVAEMSEMVGQTSAARLDISRHYLFHMGVTAWKA